MVMGVGIFIGIEQGTKGEFLTEAQRTRRGRR